jgi:NitT/TauT family transport system substrate-binding protein
MHLRRFTLIAALTALVALPLSPASVLGQTDNTLVRVGIGPVDQATPMVYASEAGIYKKHGVNVEVVKLPSGNALAAAVAGGSLELAMGSTLAAVIAISRGLPFTIVGNLAMYDSSKPDAAMLVLANSPLRTPKDLEGKTLAAVSLQDLNSVATFAWLDSLGVDRTSLKYVELPASATLAAMERGQVVASTIYEPFYSAMMSTGKVRALGYPWDGIGKRWSSAVMFGTKPWVDSHRDLVERYLRATQEASQYIAAHESESAGIIGRFTGVDPAQLTGIKHAQRGTAIAPVDLQAVIDAALKYKVIQTTIPAQDMICSCAPRR